MSGPHRSKSAVREMIRHPVHTANTNTKIQNYKNIKLHKYKITQIQKLKNTQIQNYANTKLHKYTRGEGPAFCRWPAMEIPLEYGSTIQTLSLDN